MGEKIFCGITASTASLGYEQWPESGGGVRLNGISLDGGARKSSAYVGDEARKGRWKGKIRMKRKNCVHCVNFGDNVEEVISLERFARKVFSGMGSEPRILE